jgi:hypothetical protein
MAKIDYIIFAMSGFTIRSSVFCILNDANIELTRIRGPIGPRKKRERCIIHKQL